MIPWFQELERYSVLRFKKENDAFFLNEGRPIEKLNHVSFGFQASTIDGRRKGACLFCQEYFMDLYLLAELKTISLKVSNILFDFVLIRPT